MKIKQSGQKNVLKPGLHYPHLKNWNSRKNQYFCGSPAVKKPSPDSVKGLQAVQPEMPNHEQQIVTNYENTEIY